MQKNSFDLVNLLRGKVLNRTSKIRLREGEAPHNWNGSAWIPTGSEPLDDMTIRHLIRVPLTDEEFRVFDQKSFVEFSFRVKDLGDFVMEAYFRLGRHEALIRNPGHYNLEEDFSGFDELMSEHQKNPGDANVYYNLGSSFYELREYQSSWRAYEKARQLCPGDADILSQIGILFALYLSRPIDAVDILNEALGCPNPPANAFIALASLLAKDHQTPRAVEIAQQGLLRHPEDPRLVELVGKLSND